MPAHFRIRRLGTIAWCLALAACEHVANPPDSTDPPELFQNGTVADASSELGEGASAFAAVTLGEDGLLARRITLSPPGEREAVVGRVTALEVSGSAGSLTLNLSGLEVLFDGETQFTAGEGEPVAAEIALARLSAALAEGGHPWVEAARPAADAPQAPGDATFRAQVIRLVGEADARQVRLNVDLDNLVRNTSPPPDGWLAVLGLRIEIRVSEGLTEIHIANHAVDRREFRGPVASVNLEERSLTLTDGTVIRAAGETEIALYRHDAAELPSLEAAAQALDAGLAVIAAGVGLVQSEEPLVLVALRLRLALHAELREFRGTVAYVDLSARRFTLEDGTVVRLFAGTVIYFGDDPVRYRSLEAVAEAVAAGITVRAAGMGAVLSEGLLLGLKVSFTRALREFQGAVAAVDLAARTVRLEDGTVIKVPPDPAGIHRSDADGTLGDRVILPSLEAVARALEAGQSVMAAGVGWVESHEPLTIVAVRVVFFLPPPPLHRFDGVVASVNLDQRTVTLEGGTLIRVPDDDLIHDGEEGGDALESLSDVADALAEGERVVAHGVGELESTEPRILVAVKVLFVVEPPGLRRFEGTVMSVDLASHTLTLKGGTRIRMGDETRVHSEGTGNLMLSSLEAVARAIADGQTVWTAGAGTVESEEPLIIVAAEIAFFARPPVYVFFEGTVESVDLEARTVTLEGGRLLSVSEGTEIVVTDHTLPSLEAVAEALEAGETVVAAGVAAPPAAEGEPEPVAKIVFVVAG